MFVWIFGNFWSLFWFFRFCLYFIRFSTNRPSGPKLSIGSISFRVSVCVFTFEVPVKRLFAPTSWRPMSNIFRDSEFLGKNSGNKWSQIWSFLFVSGLKYQTNKNKKIWADFSLQNMVETTLPDGLETSSWRAYR